MEVFEALAVFLCQIVRFPEIMIVQKRMDRRVCVYTSLRPVRGYIKNIGYG